MLLSLIIPFFNSEEKCKRLLATLSGLNQRDIEFILINDGSTDRTYSLLQRFKANVPNSNVQLIDQNNQGPGGARNSGLRIAQGKYVWFFDSDDEIRIEAIEFLKEISDKNYDFIDFNVKSGSNIINSMNVKAGEYIITEDCRAIFIDKFDRISSKAIRRNFLLENNIFYPEYCLYEDNPLTFIYPLLVNSFFKTDIVGYIHHKDFASITRSEPSLRTLDRLYTSVYGFTEASKLAKTTAQIDKLKVKFLTVYLMNTVGVYISIVPSKKWLITWRVMKEYRKLNKKLDINLNPFCFLKGSYKFKLYFTFHWAISFLITTDQTEYFNNIRKKAWN